MPITPLQILWVNMVTAVTLALALAFEPAEQDVMRRPPRPPQAPLLSPFLVWRVVFVSLLMVCASFGLFLVYDLGGADVATARTVAVNTLVLCEIVYLFNTRVSVLPALSWRSLRSNPLVWYAVLALLVFQGLFTYLPVFQALFDTRPLNAATWGLMTLTVLVVFLLVELEKLVLRRVNGNSNGNGQPIPSGENPGAGKSLSGDA